MSIPIAPGSPCCLYNNNIIRVKISYNVNHIDVYGTFLEKEKDENQIFLVWKSLKSVKVSSISGQKLRITLKKWKK